MAGNLRPADSVFLCSAIRTYESVLAFRTTTVYGVATSSEANSSWILVETTSEETLMRMRLRFSGEAICDGSAPVLSFRFLSGYLPCFRQQVTKMRIPPRGVRGPPTWFFSVLRGVRTSTHLYFEEQLSTEKRHPWRRTRRRCLLGPLPKRRSSEGVSAITGRRFATNRRPGRPYAS